ncbi:MAG: hypothetical protein IE913_00290 [Halothiobacillus sp.]|nr:hypothetical protein [Halothiobacillus sp.]
MAEITFVKWAGGKLSKKFTSAGETHAPLAKRISSYTVEYHDIQGLFDAVASAAYNGHAMFSGMFTHTLENESRSNKYVAGTMRDWLCLDLDGMMMESVEEVIGNIPELRHTSYVVQYSNSHKLTKPGVNAHVWFLLDKALSPEALSLWLQSINFMDAFAGELGISATATSLTYPIDITLAQESRLIYVAPPIITADSGLTDPFKDEPRIQLVRKEHERVRMNLVPKLRFDKEVISATKLSILNSLRQSHGFNSLSSDQVGDWLRPETVDGVTVIPRMEVQTEDRSVMRCDIIRTFPDGTVVEGTKMSWWFDVGYIDETTLLYNFKGEPPLRLKKSAPEFAAEWNSKYADETLPDLEGLPDFLLNTSSGSKDRFPLEGEWKRNNAFFARDIEKDEYIGVRVKADKTGFVINKVSRASAANFSNHYGAKLDKETFTRCPSVRRVKVLTPPANVFRDEHGDLCLNEAYIPEVLLVDVPFDERIYPSEAVSIMATQTPYIYRYLMHTFGTEELTARFINWAMCHLRGINVQTAWLLRGTPGSGKSSIVTEILHRLLTDGKQIGYSPTISMTQDKLMDDKNGYLAEHFFIEATEFNDRGLNTQARTTLVEKLKDLVSQEYIALRKMHTDTHAVRNVTALVITSNEPLPFELPQNDRRFEVPPYVTTGVTAAFPDVAIQTGGAPVLPEDFFDKYIEQEMPMLKKILAGLKLKPEWAARALDTTAKQQLADGGANSEDALAKWLMSGDLDSLGGAIADAIDSEDGMAIHPDAKLAREFLGVAARNPNGATYIPVEHMQAIYRLLFPHYAKVASATAVGKALNRRHPNGLWPKVHPAEGILSEMGYELEGRPRAYNVDFGLWTHWNSDDYTYWMQYADGLCSSKQPDAVQILPFIKKIKRD